MRTSNKILLATLVIFVVSLGIYNCALRAEFLTGDYKNPFKNYNTVDIKNFDRIEINAASQMDVSINKGDTKIHVTKSPSWDINFTLKGKTLVISMVRRNYAEDSFNSVIISCPKLISVKAQAFYMYDTTRIVDNHEPTNYRYERTVTVNGFTMDSLNLQQDNYSRVRLNHNTIGLLQARAGISKNATSMLSIDKTNMIQKADLQIGEKSTLELDDIFIPQLKYLFADSSKVTFSGVALKSLKQ
ncbi:hypothetical protein [Mucilaginibacter paludis]|uniref:Uncharacterized protein n=1 Tax=Mucilaginibacter paludis DSM 18603 TaxID=714943 RepID=H1YDP9_9SPHI|nr:hypothetical protein [Mucilaginibacter paludis]EHQ30738.1 hypothetical protein Mucpa_6688 [Mucilaginibacter paludis DSM 18603]